MAANVLRGCHVVELITRAATAARAGAPTAALAGRGVVCRDLRAIRTRPARQSLSCPSRFAMTVAGNQVDTARRTNLGGVLRRADGWGALIGRPTLA